VILVDTSIWIDHFRETNQVLEELISRNDVLTHPFVIGEVAMGNLRQRDVILTEMRDLPQAISAMDDEVLDFVREHSLFGLGIGFVDAHLLAAARLTQDTALWTRDKRLDAAAQRLSLAARVVN
jgi:predicted nucleic acid-binding protein